MIALKHICYGLFMLASTTIIHAASQTKHIQTQINHDTFNHHFLVEKNKQLSTIATHAFPAIVNISSTPTSENNTTYLTNDSLAPPSPYFRHEKNLGSGFIISEDGYILTNHHVVQNADTIDITMENGHTDTAQLIGSDPKTDVALLKISESNLPYLEFANSDTIKVGELAIALGNPFQIGATFTLGVISGIGRHNMGITAYEDFIQTDAVINQGNSGGPLLDIYGRVMGINTAILSKSGGSQGIGLAIPSNMAKTVIDSLKTHGKIIRSYLGVHSQDLSPKLRHAFGLKKTQKGALVTQVLADSPAHQAGLENGDIIIAFNNKPITNATILRNMVALSPTNTPIKLQFLRSSSIEHRYIKLAHHTQSPPQPHSPTQKLENSMTLSLISDKHRRQRNLPHQMIGLIVSNITPGNKADISGIKNGDIILSINNTRVSKISVAKTLFKQARKKQRPIAILIYRNGKNHLLVIS